MYSLVVTHKMLKKEPDKGRLQLTDSLSVNKDFKEAKIRFVTVLPQSKAAKEAGHKALEQGINAERGPNIQAGLVRTMKMRKVLPLLALVEAEVERQIIFKA